MARLTSSVALRADFGGGALPGLDSLGERELRLLRSFAVVVSAGGLSPAAATLGVDLSTVSRQLRETEAWLGVALARRGRGGFALTPAGEQLQRLVAELFGAARAFESGLGALRATAAPLLRLGLVDALLGSEALAAPGCSLPEALARCSAEHPGLQWQLHTLRPQEIERGLLAGTLDAGVMAARPPVRGLEQHPLWDEPNQLYAGPGHPWHARARRPPDEAELAQVRLVTDPYFDTGPAAELLPASARAHATRADSVEGVALLVASGAAVGFLPEPLVQGTPALRRLRPVAPARFGHAQRIVLACRAGKAGRPLRSLLRALLPGG